MLHSDNSSKQELMYTDGEIVFKYNLV